MALTQLSDVIVPSVFTPYVQLMTEEKSRLVQSGALVTDQFLNTFLQGGGLTINAPSWVDLGNTAANVSTDDVSDVVAASYSGGTPNPRLDATPLDTSAVQEVAVRLNRNQHWAAASLTALLAGSDPMASIASRVANYWVRELQRTFVAIWNGVLKDNIANDSSDYMNDVSGSIFVDGVTNFSAEALIDAAVTAGDSMDMFTMLMVHSRVHARMLKNNLIDFIPDSEGRMTIPTFMGKQVIIDDGMPVTSSVYDSWLFGAGATRLGNVAPPDATNTSKQQLAANGAGNEYLHSRVQWCLHPAGHAYIGSSPNGGPGNGTGANAFNAAASWNRVWTERKQIRFAVLRTREA